MIPSLRGTLCVSCQAYPGEPMYDPATMAKIAQAAQIGGAGSVRAQGIYDIRMIKAVVDVPVVGLWKDGASGVYITPTLFHAQQCVLAGADIIALDGTRRERPDGRTFAQTLTELRAWARETRDEELVIMADCGSLDDALASQEAGADFIGTTLAGYTGERAKTDGPDFELIEQVVANITQPIVVEGRIGTPAQAKEAFTMGAHMVCVGSAITHPTSITRNFLAGINS